MLSAVISVCCSSASGGEGGGHNSYHLCFKFTPSGPNSSFIVGRYVMCFSLSVTNEQIACEGAASDEAAINESHRKKPRWCLQRAGEGRMTGCRKKGRPADQVWAGQAQSSLGGGGSGRAGGQLVILAEGRSRRGLRRWRRGTHTHLPEHRPET